MCIRDRLHALHYHQINVFSKQKELKKRTPAKLEDILTIPIADRPNWSMEEITKELENNAQGILGYVCLLYTSPSPRDS